VANFTSGELLTLRREYLRDLAITSGAGEFISYYNLAKKIPFVTDNDCNAIKARVERDYDLQLDSLYDTHVAERLAEGDSPATAATSAAAQLLDAVMRLVRAEVREMQITDSGYLDAITDGTVRAQIIAEYKLQIQRDRNHVRARTSAPFSSVRLDRG
jgi:hypothetical protein